MQALPGEREQLKGAWLRLTGSQKPVFKPIGRDVLSDAKTFRGQGRFGLSIAFSEIRCGTTYSSQSLEIGTARKRESLKGRMSSPSYRTMPD